MRPIIRPIRPRECFVAVTALLALAVGLWATPLAAWFDQQRTPRLSTPSGWPSPVYDAGQNPVTKAGFELGRRLFYDTRLSKDGTIACASCHQQFAGFAHYDHRVSHGLNGANGTRNAPGLANLAWQRDFMWDGGIVHLELQPLAPLTNPVEMGETLARVLAKLRSDASYKADFERAFGPVDAGGQVVDSQRLLYALSQFLVTMISADSRYDRHVAGRETFSTEEERGLASFREHCASCHQEPLFTDHAYRSDGVVNDDIGRALITGKPEDRGLFRVPSLRNVALTAPYMHDGRFDTLEQVIQHYRGGIAPAALNDPKLRQAASLSDADAADLLAFLQTLSDERFVHDRRFAEAAAH
ncbi:MAG: cytochrome-c peroxidase [Hydrocarboniphaga sp.]|uniref:cytochrome-c peroxidase n=1 Tax=Hydrocarboniphaga sp. TaxID=2033016 RepID=UPI002607DF31|nr:cytochrome c peroxidase [Hydrocarboniphaga sp.]MDB5969724.1 cytochrome-c peroxidase [Hydrocarboniphaga sp.]